MVHIESQEMTLKLLIVMRARMTHHFRANPWTILGWMVKESTSTWMQGGGEWRPGDSPPSKPLILGKAGLPCLQVAYESQVHHKQEANIISKVPRDLEGAGEIVAVWHYGSSVGMGFWTVFEMTYNIKSVQDGQQCGPCHMICNRSPKQNW